MSFGDRADILAYGRTAAVQVGLDRREPAERSPSRRRRVLISAFAVSPCRGSEPAAGWNIPLRLAAYHDITVLCPPRIPGEPYRDEIRQYLAAHGPVTGLSFEYVHLPAWAYGQIERSADTPLGGLRYYAAYRAWQKAAYVQAVQLHREHRFALVHQLNLSGFREPGYLWQLDVPFLWGPIGGAANLPWSYMAIMGWRDRLHHCCRNGVNLLQQRLSGRSRRAAHSAWRIWVTDEDDHRMVHDVWKCAKVSVLPDSGTSVRPLAHLRDYDGSRPFRLIWSGQHIGRKALPILLHAMAALGSSVPLELGILGAGPETTAWKKLAQRLEVEDRIRWVGRVSHDEALAEVARADALVFTSLLEGTPHAVMEALSLGVPVICHDACGMGSAVTAACGIKIPPRGIGMSVGGFAEAIRRLQGDPAEVRQLSVGAMCRAMELSWDAKAACIAAAYDEVLAARRGREGFRDDG